MGFLDYLKSKLFGNVGSVESNGFENKNVEVNEGDNYSRDSGRQGYWKEFYFSDGTHVSRHGDDEDFEKRDNENDSNVEKGFFFMRKREDFEMQDPIFDSDYNYSYP